ncbi:hypothetical protein M431DRAFT_490173 [Trichoderma harzianum CBS 226.95]|uniref:Transcription factor hoxa13 n=1 Tax=Trichoderma harzianum CBS 226.95 TaxID=983964 RepID=A0A2T4ANF7_TRIHA|nr:hypothetical protein M431DRAFT_490173 [Trichoderma harzianum CBS 226.95]PTB58560.1 hypothetical protein M431DRAFT_490173 [Trichoderma harzianum CBS 226.95]
MAESSGLKPGNGSHVNGKMNGQTPGKKLAAPRPRRGFVGWVAGAVARLATWAFILTLLFRCPSTLEECDQDSPFICKPYFQAKAAVAPYTLPYYDQYIAPYADFAWPYYQAVDSSVLTPARTYAVQYGGPWVEKGQEQVWAQWEKHGQPQVAQLRALSQKQYEETIAPYMERAGEVFGPYYEIGHINSLRLYYQVLLPSYELVQPYAHQGYNAASSFTTGTALPAAQWVWGKTNAFLNKAVWPQVRMVYVENVEPQLVRIGERLERYKNRAKTRVLPEVTSSSTRRKTTTEPPRYSSFSKPAPQGTQSASTTASESVAPPPSSSVEQQPVTESYWNPVQAPPAAENETEKRRIAREMVAQDLEMWQNKFAAQAEEGAADMEDRIDEIANRMVVDEIVSKGKPLVKKLEALVQSETDGLKAKIASIVAENAANPLDDAQEQIVAAIRAAGIAIKTAAQGIRSWREEYDDNLQYMVLKAADVHFQILDETTNLALQQLGMKWAWTDGVTYRDWAKYHELKQTLGDWTEELKHLIVTHPTLLQAQDAAALVEDDGMTIASSAAKELARLKQVAQWKILANDATDNFDSEAMEKAAEAAQNPVVPEDETTVESYEQGDDEAAGEPSAETANETHGEETPLSAADNTVLEAVLEAVAEEATPGTTDEATSPLESDSADEVIDDAVVDEESSDEELPIVDDAGSNVFEHVVEEHADLNEKAQEPLTSQTDEVPDSLEDGIVEPEVEVETAEIPVSHDNEESSSAVLEEPSITPSAATTETVLESEPEETAEAVLESEDDILDEDEISWQQDQKILDNDSASVKATFLGAAAQVVSGWQPILDDEDDETDDNFLSSATKAAEAAYASAISLASDQYSSASSIISAQVHGTPTPAVQNQLLSSVSAAYDQAVAAASSRFKDVVDAASAGVYGTPTTTPATPTQAHWSKVESIAAERLNEGKLWAELQYQSALIALGLATATPTSTSAAEKYYEQAKYNYYAGLGMAHDRYNNFISAASSALSSLTATPTPTPMAFTDSAISMASAAGKAAESAYAKATENVASAVEAVDDSISSLHDAATEQIYNAGLAIGETFGTVISQLSIDIYGQPTPAAIGWYEGWVSDAQAVVASATSAVGRATETASAGAAKEYESVSELVSELIVGREAPFTESVLSRLQAAYASATQNVASLASEASAAAGSVGEKVGSIASKATDAAKHGKDEL